MHGVIERIKGYLHSRKRAYQLAFGSPAGNEVLVDLAKFCRAAEPCFHDDPRKHALLEGRREVFIRIQDHLHLTQDQLYALYAGHNIQVKDESND